jgi:hypothetical protein
MFKRNDAVKTDGWKRWENLVEENLMSRPLSKP